MEEKSFILKGGGKRGAICYRCKYDRRTAQYKLNQNAKRRGYLLTLEEYNALLEKQNGQCAICKDEAKLVVDHDHGSGKVRGLLCNNCNAGLGMLKDSPDILRAASQYILDEG